MSTISDEIGSLVQHVKDIAANFGHLLTGQAREEFGKLEQQAGALHDVVKADVEQDAADVAADVRSDEQAAQTATSAPATPVTPSVPMTSAPSEPATSEPTAPTGY